jgi:5-methylcytosine-specific restriction protein A
MQRTNGLCEMCLKKNLVNAAAVVDHELPLALGGSDEDSNTRNLCKPCHDEVTAEQFGHRRKVATGLDGWPS